MGPEAALAALEERYRRLLVEQFDRLTFKGISRSGKAVSLPLEDVYVDLKAVADVPDAADAYSADERRLLLEAEVRGMPEGDLRRQLDSLRVERWREESRRGGTRLVRRSIAEAIADPSRPGLVILGDPGSGKTTLLHYLALRAAKESAPRARLPIFVPLAAYDDWLRRDHAPLSLGDFLAVYYDKWCCLSGLGPLFQRALDEGRALVLLDGLDEALDVTTRRHIAGQARALIQGGAGRGNRFVITSRIVGYREAPLPGELPCVTVLDFGEAEIAAFAHRWCEACEAWFAGGQLTDAARRKAAKEEKDLLAEVRANPSVLRLAANPLLLTMLALLKRQGGKLPEERVRLYERYVDTLIDNWEVARSEGARTREASRFDRNLATNYLIELALWLQRCKPSGTAQRRELELALVEIALRVDGIDPVKASAKDRQQAHEKAALFLKDMRHFAGLLAERGQDAFGFLHLTFQEYFVGRALARTEPEERWAMLKEHLHRPRWREPILLCAGQLGIVEGRSKAVSELGRRVLGAGSPHEEILHRDVFLTAAMAGDGVGFERGLLDELAGRLAGLADDRVPAVRREARGGLAQLARLGHEGTVRWLEERIRLKVQPAEMAWALRGVLGAESCARLRQAICQWLEEPNHELRLSAIQALAIMAANDPEIESLLLAKLEDPHPDVQAATLEVLGDLASSDENIRCILLTKLDSQDEYVQARTLRALKDVVLSDKDVRHLLLGKMAGWSRWTRRTAIEVLEATVPGDEDVHGAVVAMLDDHDETIREAAVSALAAAASSNGESRRRILAMLDDPEEGIREAAVRALKATASSDGESRRRILAMLDAPEQGTREAAVSTLRTMVPKDEEVRRLILGKINDKYSRVRLAALNALKPLMSSDAETRQLILGSLNHQQWHVLPQMIDALGGMVTHDGEVRRLILTKLDAPELVVRWAAIHALGALVLSDGEVRSHILAMLDAPEEMMRQAALSALGALVPSDGEVRSLILAKLDAPEETMRQAALSVLGARIPSDDEIRRRILAMLDDPAVMVRQTALSALGVLVPYDDEIRRRILAMLDDPAGMVRRAAVSTLGTLVASDGEIRRLILAMLHNPGTLMRWAAVSALGVLVASDGEIRRLILAKLDDPALTVRQAAVSALGALVSSDGEIRRLILAKLDDPAGMVRQAAVSALGALVSSDGELRRLILAKLDDAEEMVRQAAVSALDALVPRDDEIRHLFLTKLDDTGSSVRHAIIGVIASQFVEDRELARRLLGWLGMVTETGPYADRTRRRLAAAYAPLLAREPELFARVRSMLESPAWPERQGAAWALIAMPGGPPQEVLPVLRGLLGDLRAEESWPERLETAAILINDRDVTISRRALATAMEALEYATEPWYDMPHQGGFVRAKAAEVLGALEPMYRSDEVFARLTRILREDGSEEARDAAYHALLRLAVAPEAEHDLESLRTSPASPEQRPAAPPSPPTALSPLPRSFALHLSDLHFGTAENATLWSSQLAEDLRTELGCARLDALLLSGDIANHATPDEYAAALAFLQKLCAEFHLAPEQIIPVPGNHDLSWALSEDAYQPVRRAKLKAPPAEGSFIERDGGLIELRDDALYLKRFEPFAAFYEALRGKPYPLDPARQALLYPLPAQRLLVLGLNSAWSLDHHFRARASIHPEALAHALDRVRAEPAYKDFLKIAVWHHPVQSSFEDRIKDHGFLERLAGADFRLGLHGHIHKAQSNLYRYDMNPAGRRLELVCAGTFGAPTKELLPGYPFQYQLLCFQGDTLTVETRRREEINGTWKPDARWTTARGKDPAPRYTVPL